MVTACPRVLLCLTCLTCLAAVSKCFAANPQQVFKLKAGKPPQFPEAYQVSYNYSLPYTAKIQPNGIRYPITFWRDPEGQRYRMDTYSGTNSILRLPGIQYELEPRIHVQRCWAYKLWGGEANGLLHALPDVSGWDFGGEHNMSGRQAQLWFTEQKHEGKQVWYKFYVAEDGTPLRLHMHGPQLFTGAHLDEYVADYYYYRPGRPDSSAFQPPKACHGVQQVVQQPGQRSPHSMRMTSLLPSVKYAGDPHYDAFLSTHGSGRKLHSLDEYRNRAEVYRANAELIATHNARPEQERRFSMAMNRFGDWTREEFIALMLPKASQSQQAATASSKLGQSSFEIPHRPLTDPARVPRSVSWRGSGADARLPADQANCGSCWAFGAAGAMESAWFMATGQQVSFSEQQLMDCAWDFGSSACDGGTASAGVEYVVSTGGIAPTPDYEYLGQAGYCHDEKTRRVGKFKGFSRIPPFNDTLLMEAVYSRGPLAVSLDASQPSFTFYSGGVYYDPACLWKPGELDHSEMLVGYGSDEKGGDFWLVRNSWSAHWGDHGYVKFSRDNGACGIPTDPLYAVVDDRL